MNSYRNHVPALLLIPIMILTSETSVPGAANWEGAAPVLVVQFHGVSATVVGDYLTGVATRSETARGWSGRMSRQLSRLPFGLNANENRGRGFAYFWQPQSDNQPRLAEYVEILPTEQVDADLPPGGKQESENSGRFTVSEVAPGRWVHAFHAVHPTTGFVDGSLVESQVTNPEPLFSRFYATHDNAIWESGFPMLLAADLPDLDLFPVDRPGLKFQLDFSSVDQSQRDAWLQAFLAGSAVSQQERDSETTWQRQSRLTQIEVAQAVCRLLLSDGGKLEGSANTTTADEFRMQATLHAAESQLLSRVCELAVSGNALTAVEQELPWLSVWSGFRIDNPLREALQNAASSFRHAADTDSRNMHLLLESLSNTGEIQLALAVVNDPSGIDGVLVGIRIDNADRVRPVMEDLVRRATVSISNSANPSQIAFSGDSQQFWAVIGTSDPQSIAIRLNETVAEPARESSNRLFALQCDFNSVPQVSALDLRNSGQPVPPVREAFNRLRNLTASLRRSHVAQDASFWKLAFTIEGTESGLDLRMHAGRGAAESVIAAAISQIDAVQRSARSLP